MLKTVFNFNTAHVATRALLAVALASLPASFARADEEPLQRLAALVDYVAADYAGAVRDGKVVAATEYDEQRGLLRDAVAMVARLPDQPARAATAQALARVVDAVEQRRSPDEVAAACRVVRARLVEPEPIGLGLVLAPSAPPDRERAVQLYKSACASCHGDDGAADTARARELKPPPVSFLDGERMSRISPQLAYHALTFGVQGTAMASFDTLPAADRWSLAYHVVALRHLREDAAAGARAVAAASPPLPPPTASRLAGLSDRELDAQLAPSLPSAPERAAAIAWLRREASFAAGPGGAFGEARRKLGALAAAAPERRHDLVSAAYLDGVEPHEASLRARDRALADRIERAFLGLRDAVDHRAPDAAISRRVAQLSLLLDRAEERPSGPGVAFVAALTIALREGLEAALLVAALLAFLRKSGRARSANLVHLGWLAALPAGAVTWFIAGALVDGARRELVEAVVTLVAAVMIIGVSHWVLGREEAKHWVGFLRRRVMAAAPGDRSWPLFALAFIAAYREAFEVVLFYRALLLDVGPHRSAVALGAAAGVVAIALVVIVVARLGRTLNPRPVMLASSILLAALAVALVGRGVRALQEGGYLGLTPLALPDLSTVGLYPTLQGLIAQGLTLAALFVPSLAARLRRSAAAPATGRADQPAARKR